MQKKTVVLIKNKLINNKNKQITVLREEATSALAQWFSFGSSIIVELEFGVLVTMARTSKKPNPHKAPGRNEPRPHWSLHPLKDL